jgi:hypothetical protein
MFIGLGLVAVWTYCRYPRLRPSSLIRAVLHVVVSFASFALLPAVLTVVLPPLPTGTSRLYAVLVLLIPALTYLLLSWVWLIGRILHDIGGTPRGGHRVSATSS